jgi:hypothetical protein
MLETNYLKKSVQVTVGFKIIYEFPHLFLAICKILFGSDTQLEKQNLYIPAMMKCLAQYQQPYNPAQRAWRK